MKTNEKKLALSQETIRNLTDTGLKAGKIKGTITCVCGVCTCPPPR
jgi:hypothetical protein